MQKPKTYKPPGSTSATDRRSAPSTRGYGRRWQAYRRWFLSQPENVICASCDAEPASHVDHVERRPPDSESFFDTANHQGLCQRCHSIKTARFDMGRTLTADDQRELERMKAAARERAQRIAAAGGGYA